MSANRKRLTEASVLSLPCRSRPYRVWDSGTGAVRGLSILIQPTGTKTYRVACQHTTVKLGRVGVLSLEDARAKALQAQRLAAKGEDPRLADPQRTDTFKALVELWTRNEQHGRKRAVSADATETAIINACEAWHAKPIGTIRYQHIDDLLCEVRDRAPYMANYLFRALATFFRWCVRTKRLQVNPMEAMPLPFANPPGRKRAWFKGEAADALIKSLWQFADHASGDKGKFLKLLLLTGKRRSAILEMEWRDIDPTWFWSPPEGSKHKRCTPIPLPRLAQRVLGPRQAEGIVLGRLDVQTLVNNARAHMGVDDFLLHGIRHVVATKLRELKVKPHIARMLLDHVVFNDVHADYEHADYTSELGEALELWANYVEQLVQPAEAVRVLR